MPLKPMRRERKLGSTFAPQIEKGGDHLVANGKSSTRIDETKMSSAQTSVSSSSENDSEEDPPLHEINDGFVHSSRRNKEENQSISGRRSIFTQYKKEEDDPEVDDGNVASCRIRASSILQFSPPPEHTYELGKRFTLPNEFPHEKAQGLPPLPTPLLRYANEGSTSSGGVYPLVEPKSILRQGKFSCSPTGLTQEESSLSTSDEPDTNLLESVQSDECMYGIEPANNSELHDRNLVEFERIARGLSLEDTKRYFRQSDSTDSERDYLIKFDPRIVITEFPDDPERTWFNDDDLNRFKRETLMLAQHYMILHPEVADEYNLPSIDPITGKVRKKALYAMPGLCSDDGLDAFGSSDEIQKFLENAVRKILIVDPNNSILELFQKSIQQMFPTAKFALVQTGEEALRVFEEELEREKNRWDGHRRGFDVVVVEEQLSRQRPNTPSRTRRLLHSARLTRRKRPESPVYSNSSTVLNKLSDSRIPKHRSLHSLETLSTVSLESDTDWTMSGSELIERICALEEEVYSGQETTEQATDADESSVFAPLQRRSLLIGVTVNTGRDSQKLRNSGADLIWGKPPPTMNDRLRNKIISKVIAKRQTASLNSVSKRLVSSKES